MAAVEPVEPSSDAELNSAKERAWREVGAIDAAYARGDLDVHAWHDAMRALVEPAYLSAATAEMGSGHSGDAESWEYSHRPLLDAVQRDGTFLDIGCANGLLMQTITGWAAAEGRRLEPYGVDISSSLAHLARDRCPQWADRIWTGNAATWRAPRLFDYVRTGLEYVPTDRQAAYVDHLLSFLVPGGRLIIGKYNEETDLDTWASAVEGWGHPVVGRSTRAHRSHPALSYKVFWVER
jgi:SAM-dependent methyltransferase